MTEKLTDRLRAIQHYDMKNMYDNIELAYKAADALDAKDEALYRCDQQAEAYQSQIERLDAEIERLKAEDEHTMVIANQMEAAYGRSMVRNALLEEVVEAAQAYMQHSGQRERLSTAIAKIERDNL